MQVWKQATHHDRRQGNLPSVVLWHGVSRKRWGRTV